MSFKAERAKRPQHADTAKILKIAEPTIVPMLMSSSVMNVPTQLMHSSGDEVAIVINVATATSCFILNSKKRVIKIFFTTKNNNLQTLTKDMNGSDEIFITYNGQHPETIASQHHVQDNANIFLNHRHMILLLRLQFIVRVILEGPRRRVTQFFNFRHRFIFRAEI